MLELAIVKNDFNVSTVVEVGCVACNKAAALPSCVSACRSRFCSQMHEEIEELWRWVRSARALRKRVSAYNVWSLWVL